MFNLVDEWSKMPKKSSKDYDKALKPRELVDFEKMVQNSLPNWSVVWNMVAQTSREKKKDKIGKRTTKLIGKATVLEKKIQKKVHELVTAQETLLNLYKEAAEVARFKEEEFKGKTASLLEQIKKDKHFLRELKETEMEKEKKNIERGKVKEN